MFKATINQIPGFCGGSFVKVYKSDLTAGPLGGQQYTDGRVASLINDHPGISFVSTDAYNLLRENDKVNDNHIFHKTGYGSGICIPPDMSREAMINDGLRGEAEPATTFQVLETYYEGMGKKDKELLNGLMLGDFCAEEFIDIPRVKVLYAKALYRKSTDSPDYRPCSVKEFVYSNIMFSKDILGTNPSTDFKEVYDVYPSFVWMLLLWAHSYPVGGTLERIKRSGSGLDASTSIRAVDPERIMYIPPSMRGTRLYLADAPVFRNFNYDRGSLCMSVFR